MKLFYSLFLTVILVSCSENAVPKPAHLLEKDEMINLLVDVALLQASEAAMPYYLNGKNIKIATYIYDKYKIDSTTYYQNQKYYASKPADYKKMHQKVLEKLEQEKQKYATDPQVVPIPE